MTNLKTRIKAQEAFVSVYKREAKKLQCSEPFAGSHTTEWYYYIESRKELRALYLVYGFKRGLSYSQIEPVVRTKPDWEQFRKIAFKHGVQTPWFREWHHSKLDFSQGLLEDLNAFIQKKWGDKADHPPYVERRIRSYVEMEEWITEAKQHFTSCK